METLWPTAFGWFGDTWLQIPMSVVLRHSQDVGTHFMTKALGALSRGSPPPHSGDLGTRTLGQLTPYVIEIGIGERLCWDIGPERRARLNHFFGLTGRSHLGDQVKGARRASGLSPAELSECSGMPENDIVSLENGQAVSLSSDILQGLARCLKYCTEKKLLRGLGRLYPVVTSPPSRSTELSADWDTKTLLYLVEQHSRPVTIRHAAQGWQAVWGLELTGTMDSHSTLAQALMGLLTPHEESED